MTWTAWVSLMHVKVDWVGMFWGWDFECEIVCYQVEVTSSEYCTWWRVYGLCITNVWVSTP